MWARPPPGAIPPTMEIRIGTSGYRYKHTGFLFAVKGSRFLTHMIKLRDPGKRRVCAGISRHTRKAG